MVGLISLRGRFNYTNLSRYSDLNEKTYRRRFEGRLDFTEFNQLGIREVTANAAILIAAMDCSFIQKSGDKTYGLGKFFDSKQGKADKGLEISTLAVIDVDYNTAYQVSTRQTPPASKEGETRVNDYIRHFEDDCHLLPKSVRYVALDAYYTKQSFTHAILEKGYHQIGKLRRDANLRYLYTGEQKPRGRRKTYAGKMVIGELDHLEFVGEQADVKLYTAIVNCVNLKRDIRIVYLLKNTGQFALLFSTDTALDARSIVRYYKARFQIEFLFRDAKQFTGLCDCQARSEDALHSHFNASFTALNLIKWQDRLLSPERKAISVSSWKTRFFNALLIDRFSYNFDLDLNSIKSSPLYEELCNLGVVSC